MDEVFTGWDPSTGAQQALDIITTQEIDGIWTSGIDYTVVEQFEAADKPFVPIVGADNNGFVQQLIELSRRRPDRSRCDQPAGHRWGGYRDRHPGAAGRGRRTGRRP